MARDWGGGSSINAMYWSRGHKSDWDFFALEAGNRAWNYESVKEIYRPIEWQREADAEYRGAGGPVYVRPTEIKPVGLAMFEAMQSMGIPVFASLNGSLTMAGGSKAELINREGKRQSIFRSYIWPYPSWQAFMRRKMEENFSRSGQATEPRVPALDRSEPVRSHRNSVQCVVASRRYEGDDSLRRTLPGTRQLQRNASVCETQGYPGSAGKTRDRTVHPQVYRNLLAPELYREDGPRCHVGR
jgi:choline dehydrogenase-like flavoprotein